MLSHGRFVPGLASLSLGLSVLAVSGVLVVDDDDAPYSTPRELPPGELGKVVALGKEIVEKTGEHPISKPFVRNALTCSSCHLDAGTNPQAAPDVH
jgi:thiosulfate dehydrogenase